MGHLTTEKAVAEVRAELARQRLSIRELAARMGIPPTTMARRLRGEQEITLDELDAIADALGVSPGQFVAA